MNKYLTIIIISIYTMTSGKSTVQAQACGGGIFTFEIYTLNGEKEHNINYEIFLIKNDSLDKIIPKWKLGEIERNMGVGSVIKPENALLILDTIITQEFKNYLNFTKNQRKGKAQNGIIKFKTRELYYNPCLLKLSSNKKDVYIIVNLLGGCDKTTAILWNNNPRILGIGRNK